MVSIGDKVKIIQDNYEGVDVDSIAAYDLKIGDMGVVVDRLTFTLPEDLLVEFRFGDSQIITVIMEENELEVIEDEE